MWRGRGRGRRRWWYTRIGRLLAELMGKCSKVEETNFHPKISSGKIVKWTQEKITDSRREEKIKQEKTKGAYKEVSEWWGEETTD